MSAELPTADQLEKLPMRAVVAYAARTACRVHSGIRDIVEDDDLDDALRLVGSASTARLVSDLDQVAVVRSVERLMNACASAPSTTSYDTLHVMFCLIHASLAATHVIDAAQDPSNIRHQMKIAAEEAERAVRSVAGPQRTTAIALTEAARRDYDILVERYGESEDVVMGDPIDCFEARARPR